jgi:hypothetical protein
MMVRDGAAGAGSGGRLPLSVAERGDADPGTAPLPPTEGSGGGRGLADRDADGAAGSDEDGQA